MPKSSIASRTPRSRRPSSASAQRSASIRIDSVSSSCTQEASRSARVRGVRQQLATKSTRVRARVAGDVDRHSPAGRAAAASSCQPAELAARLPRGPTSRWGPRCRVLGDLRRTSGGATVPRSGGASGPAPRRRRTGSRRGCDRLVLEELSRRSRSPSSGRLRLDPLLGLAASSSMVETATRSPAALLRRGHGEVGHAHERLGRAPRGTDRYADAGGHEDLPARQRERRLEGPRHPLGRGCTRRRPCERPRRRARTRRLAEAGDGVGRSDGPDEALADLAQEQASPCWSPARVVQELEAVEVDEEHRDPGAGPPGRLRAPSIRSSRRIRFGRSVSGSCSAS